MAGVVTVRVLVRVQVRIRVRLGISVKIRVSVRGSHHVFAAKVEVRGAVYERLCDCVCVFMRSMGVGISVPVRISVRGKVRVSLRLMGSHHVFAPEVEVRRAVCVSVRLRMCVSVMYVRWD